jgi:putative transposase
MIDIASQVSIRRQCELFLINRSSLYKQKKSDLGSKELCQEIRNIYELKPVYGYRRITEKLKRNNIIVNKKKVQRLMKVMNLQAVHPGPNTSKRNLQEMVYPYLLKDLSISQLHQVWQIDITYIRTEKGFMYLSALIDVYSRLVVGWDLSNSLDVGSCRDALLMAIAKYGKPGIINSDQGSQFSAPWKGAIF